MQILLRNARQILSVVTATFPSFEGDGLSENCQESSSSVEDLACQWRRIIRGLDAMKRGEQNTDEWLLSVSKVSHLLEIVLLD